MKPPITYEIGEIESGIPLAKVHGALIANLSELQVGQSRTVTGKGSATLRTVHFVVRQEASKFHDRRFAIRTIDAKARRIRVWRLA